MSVWEQRQYDTPLAGRQASQGHERQPSICMRNIWESLYFTMYFTFTIVVIIQEDTESSKYYARIQTAVAHGLGLPGGWLAGRHTDAASKHSLCSFSLVSE